MRFLLALSYAFLVSVFAITSARAELVEVDVELVIAVDVSRSMTSKEMEIQRRGYAEALKSNEVVRAITHGILGRVAIMYVEWSEDTSQRVVVDWALIENAETSNAFADKLTAQFNTALKRTSISGAIDFATRSLEVNNYAGKRRVVDISGDGPNNQGRPVELARDEAVARGIIINGLPLMTKHGKSLNFHLDDLDVYYRSCVIGGPASFAIAVRKWEEFHAAVRQKLIWDLAEKRENRVPVFPVNFHVTEISEQDVDYDCLVGEKIMQRLLPDG